MASDAPQTTPAAVDWVGLWAALQDLGCVMRPLMESGNIPDWATALDAALDAALPCIEERCAEGCSDE